MRDDQRWLEEAVRLATANVADGGGPFGAVVMRDGVVVGRGQNLVTRLLDPTAHAEVVAIRAACQGVGDFSLAGCVLYSSCEPCPMCMSAALWSRVDRVVYAANRADAARGGFDDSLFYDLFSRPRETWPVPVVNDRVASAAEPFDAWLAREDRTPY
jgi:guanine deaminase